MSELWQVRVFGEGPPEKPAKPDKDEEDYGGADDSAGFDAEEGDDE